MILRSVQPLWSEDEIEIRAAIAEPIANDIASDVVTDELRMELPSNTKYR
jgi:hypothetical protein